MDLAEIGLRIKKCRRNKHLTQEEFAEKIEVSPHYIYEIERGSKAMSIYTFYNIATTLSVSADYLLYGKKASFENNISQKMPDELTLLFEQLSPKKKENVINVITALLPYIK